MEWEQGQGASGESVFRERSEGLSVRVVNG